jgi:hypothetical protein
MRDIGVWIVQRHSQSDRDDAAEILGVYRKKEHALRFCATEGFNMSRPMYSDDDWCTVTEHKIQ